VAFRRREVVRPPLKTLILRHEFPGPYDHHQKLKDDLSYFLELLVEHGRTLDEVVVERDRLVDSLVDAVEEGETVRLVLRRYYEKPELSLLGKIRTCKRHNINLKVVDKMIVEYASVSTCVLGLASQ
jgi:hypothetical protein